MAIEAATNGVIILNGGLEARSFQDLFTVLPFTFSFEEDSVAAGASSTRDITVTGAALGDFVLIAPSIDIVDLSMSGYVRATDSVTINVTDLSAGANTALATIATHNGLLLQPRGAWAIAR